MESVRDICHVLYINLENRIDRKINIEYQLAQLGLSGQRMDAIRMVNGALGCSYSHLGCLEIAKKEGWEYVMIVEDDMVITDIDLFLSQLNRFLSIHKEWDVLLLGGNNVGKYTKIDDTCVKISRCMTSVGYIVKKHYYDILINNVKKGIEKFTVHPYRKNSYAIDKYWFQLQTRDTWLLLQPLLVSQMKGYSDIEKRMINYMDAMTRL